MVGEALGLLYEDEPGEHGLEDIQSTFRQRKIVVASIWDLCSHCKFDFSGVSRSEPMIQCGNQKILKYWIQ